MPGVSSADQKREAFEMESLAWSFFSDTDTGTGCSSGLSNEFCSDNAGGFAGRVDDGAGNVNLLMHDFSGGFGVSDFGDVNCSSEGPLFDSGGFDNGQRDHGGGSFGGAIGGISGGISNSLNALVGSARLEDVISALQKYLPSNNEDESSLTTVDAYSCDEFRMYEFKVRRCMRGRSHDWTECPFAHPGEKARRRDPRRFHYSGTACPDFRKGSCRRGDSCEFAHGVFECWLHPARYRTQPCKDGRNCRRRVCFFAHTSEQLRLLPSASSPQSNGGSGSSSRSALHASALKNSLSASYDGSPRRQMAGVDGSSPSSPRGYLGKAAHALLSSPTSTLVGHSQSPPPLSPPLSPSLSPPDSPNKWLNAAATSPFVAHRVSSPARGALQKTVLSTSSLAQVQSSAGNHTMPFIQTSSISVPGHRRHLDRMASMPTITLPSSPSSLRPLSMFSDGCSQPSSPVTQSPGALAEMLNSLQSLDINSVASTSPVRSWHGSPRASNLKYCFISDQACAPPSKSSNADITEDLFEEPVQRVESGRGLRAKIYGRLTKENSLQEPAAASEAPDLGWVNELVK